MKKGPICILLLAVALMLLFGCGGDGGSGSGAGSGTGTVSMDITDAKPLVAGNPTELWVTIEKVRAHRSGGGGWESLSLAVTPFEINLLAFYDENTTELVPPTKLVAGHYTQIRIVISEAYMMFDNVRQDIVLEVPSGFLRTDKQFDFEVEVGEAVDITIDFDLSQSIKKTGEDEYRMKPVLHISETERAATICGSIAPDSFVDDSVDVTVIWHGPEGDETYTQVIVDKQDDFDGTGFCIFWLVPDQDYTVQIDNGFDTAYEEPVFAGDLGPGASYDLNGSEDIEIPEP